MRVRHWRPKHLVDGEKDRRERLDEVGRLRYRHRRRRLVCVLRSWRVGRLFRRLVGMGTLPRLPRGCAVSPSRDVCPDLSWLVMPRSSRQQRWLRSSSSDGVRGCNGMAATGRPSKRGGPVGASVGCNLLHCPTARVPMILRISERPHRNGYDLLHGTRAGHLPPRPIEPFRKLLY